MAPRTDYYPFCIDSCLFWEVGFKVDIDRHCDEVESEFRCWIDFELTLAAEFVLVNFHNGLEGVVLKITDIPTISKLPCSTCKGPTARGEAPR